jgi:hypothetical protein
MATIPLGRTKNERRGADKGGTAGDVADVGARRWRTACAAGSGVGRRAVRERLERREILAHLASIEWAYPKLIDLARGGPPPEKAAPPAPPAGVTPPSGAGTPQILNYNERQVAKRADATVEKLLDEFEQNRATTIAAVEAADEALFQVQVTSAGGAKGPLAGVMRYVAVEHVKQHVRDIAG